MGGQALFRHQGKLVLVGRIALFGKGRHVGDLDRIYKLLDGEAPLQALQLEMQFPVVVTVGLRRHPVDGLGEALVHISNVEQFHAVAQVVGGRRAHLRAPAGNDLFELGTVDTGFAIRNGDRIIGSSAHSDTQQQRGTAEKTGKGHA